MRWTSFITAPALAFMVAASSMAPAVAFADQRPPAAATDDQSIGATVFVIHASNDGTGIDPVLKPYPELKQPPFSAYNSYRLLNKKSFTLNSDGTNVSLPDGGTFNLRYNGKDGGKHAVQASITKKNGKKFLPSVTVRAKAGQTFFIAGQKHDGGILVLGIRLGS